MVLLSSMIIKSVLNTLETDPQAEVDQVEVGQAEDSGVEVAREAQAEALAEVEGDSAEDVEAVASAVVPLVAMEVVIQTVMEALEAVVDTIHHPHHHLEINMVPVEVVDLLAAIAATEADHQLARAAPDINWGFNSRETHTNT